MSNRIEYAKASAEGYKSFAAVYVYVKRCNRLQELINIVYLRASQIDGCAYGIEMHSRHLPKLGVGTYLGSKVEAFIDERLARATA